MVLTRKLMQRVLIFDPMNPGSQCWVSVQRIKGDKVRLGFEAGSNVVIHREETNEAIQREREAAAA